MYDLKSTPPLSRKYSCLSSLPKVGTYKREVCIPPPPPPPHPPPNIPYSWHIISIGPESCHQELWLVNIIPYYRRAPSKNVPSKKEMIERPGIVLCGALHYIVHSFTCCLRMTHRKKKVTKINCTTCWI